MLQPLVWIDNLFVLRLVSHSQRLIPTCSLCILVATGDNNLLWLLQGIFGYRRILLSRVHIVQCSGGQSG